MCTHVLYICIHTKRRKERKKGEKKGRREGKGKKGKRVGGKGLIYLLVWNFKGKCETVYGLTQQKTDYAHPGLSSFSEQDIGIYL